MNPKLKFVFSMILTSVFAVPLATGLSAQTEARAEPAVRVCDVLSNPKKHLGKLVTVAVVHKESFEGNSIIDLSCDVEPNSVPVVLDCFTEAECKPIRRALSERLPVDSIVDGNFVKIVAIGAFRSDDDWNDGRKGELVFHLKRIESTTELTRKEKGELRQPCPGPSSSR
ncbi:MAG: hypothetical protein AB7F88_01950 [Pyrinomonadaceae bacterium]